MNRLFWKVRGIYAPCRKPLLISLINKTHATIVGFQETKKQEFSNSFLKTLVGSRTFVQNHLPLVGSPRGILMGVDDGIFEVLKWYIGKFSITCHLRLKSSKVEFRVITVYGTP